MGKHVKSPYKNEAGNVVTCPVCGKKFVPAPYHVYHEAGGQSKKRVCSYNCAVVAQRNYEANKKKRGPKPKEARG